MSTLERLRYHALDDEASEGAVTPASAFRGEIPDSLEAVAPGSFHSDADAARFYLDALLGRDERPAMRSVRAPVRPEQVPGLEVVDSRDSPQTNTRLVRFQQSHESIVVFGSRALVELTPSRELVAVDCWLGDVRGPTSVPSIEPGEALRAVEAVTGATLRLDELKPRDLVFYEDDGGGWHLGWLLRNVSAAPPAALERGEHGGHPQAPSPRDEPHVDYIVDAHYGDVLFYYSAAPTAAGPEIPVRMQGQAEDRVVHKFLGRAEGATYHMSDPMRRIKTFDLAFADLKTAAFPATPITGGLTDWSDTQRAAISAHLSAGMVSDFLKVPLQRNGIDDGGMDLISVVNCRWAPLSESREWANAVWYQGKMWYGQTDGADGLVSMARHLDIIAHELTHGVIEHSSGLIYRDESGALNESFCDIFGVIIRNWYLAPRREDVTSWNWEVGSGFRAGGPLRDLSDPTRTNDPDHYDRRYTGIGDYGGVHRNSNIHNKAAYLLLTTTNDGGAQVFSVYEAAVLLYLCMTRLAPLASLSDARSGLADVVKTYHAGDAAERARKLAAIASSYDQVGIA